MSVIWLRRPRSNQKLISAVDDAVARELLHVESKGALSGLLSVGFRGRWVSDPECTYRACDKIFQLSKARESGFRIPETSVLQSKDDVLEFAARYNNSIIVKSLVGSPDVFLQTGQSRLTYALAN